MRYIIQTLHQYYPELIAFIIVAPICISAIRSFRKNNATASPDDEPMPGEEFNF